MNVRRASGILALLAMAQLSLGSGASACMSPHPTPDSCHQDAAPAHPEHQTPCGGGDMAGACATSSMCASAVAENVLASGGRPVAADAVRIATADAPESVTTGPESPPPRV